mmetsp:Transcript_32662/g.72155  ORF Transcript_32662/g.72155 Transcript_32662/m.72155 type:complete len:184 (+) Transcript_32662:155-706(+)|eukprot:CAMPEP_0202896046 /NCGR_PEP_ID=MMETSP1392-20130828/5127_1 /ASSEMBLY_ACC=CAM_ASM_000868 /TAXON_ID=225041 /ORGANISM="Chlamydomonas chlamydogama, Strain SAG 11-48b" /LENGTH=183 /DNA_ID=CAMNT_0049581269 /DNA_START=137 /DNA_END=688 /DNA_ORIENTATION=+
MASDKQSALKASPSPDEELCERAVKEDRVIPAGEDTVRKLMLLVGAAAATLHISKSKNGFESASSFKISTLLGLGFSFFISGFARTCGCTLRGNWRIQHKRPMGVVGQKPPEKYKAFISRKRRQLLSALGQGSAVGVIATNGLFALAGHWSKKVVKGSMAGGVASFAGLFLASAVWPARKVKA